MSKGNLKISDRILSVLLVLIMVFSMIPASIFASAAEYEGMYTIAVQDAENTAIAEAEVFYEIKVSDVKTSENTANTDADGVIGIDLAEYADELFASETVTVEYTVSKDGYQSADGVIEVTSVDGNTIVTLEALEISEINDVIIKANELTYNGSNQKTVSVEFKDGDTVTYKLLPDGTEQKEVPTVIDAGEYSVQVIVKREGYKDLVKDVNVTVKKAEINDVTLSALTELSYNGSNQKLVTVEGLLPEDVVNWTVDDKKATLEDGIPVASAVGKYTVNLTVDRGENYEKFEKDVEVSIGKGTLNLDGLTIMGVSSVYTGEAQEAVVVNKPDNSDYTLYYQLTEDENGKTDEAWSDEIPTVTNAGSYIVWVKAIKENYNDKEVDITRPEEAVEPYNVYIAKAEQDSLEFFKGYLNGERTTIDYRGEDFALDFSAIGGSGNGKISYTIESLDENNISNNISISKVGEVSVKGACTVKITATKDGDDNYLENAISHCLIVADKSKNLISFSNNIAIKYVFGTLNGTISELQAVPAKNDDTGKITYSINNNNIGINCNSESGKITINNYEQLASALHNTETGTVELIVTADKEATYFRYWFFGWHEDLRYDAAHDTYTINISFAETPENPYTLSSDDDGTTINKTVWYNRPVTVTPAEDYKISRTPSNFKDDVKFGENGNDQGVVDRYVYLQNKDGGITDKISLDEFGIDTIAPDASKMTVEIEELSLVQKIEKWFGFSKEETVEVTFTVNDENSDNESGLSSITWSYIKENDVTAAESKENKVIEIAPDNYMVGKYVATLTLPEEEAEQLRGNIKFFATDKTGNKSAEVVYKNNDEPVIVIVDTINPTLSFEHSAVEGKTAEIVGDQFYYNSSVKFTFKVEEANFFADDFNVSYSKDKGTLVTVDSIEWNTSEDNKDYHIGTFTLSDDGDYVVYASYSDNSDNNATDADDKDALNFNAEKKTYESKTITIDKTSPAVDFDFVEEETDPQGKESFIQKIIVKVNERYFRSSDISVTGNVTDINGNSVFADDISKENFFNQFNEDLMNEENWKYNEDGNRIFEKSLKDSDVYPDGTYNIEFTYTDISGNITKITPESFTIDNSAPDDITISYSTPVWQTILEVLSLGFYESSVEVTFTANDPYIGVKSFKWTYTKDENATAAIDMSGTVEAEQSEKNKIKYSATITLPEENKKQLRGHISVTAVDKYDNSKEFTDSKNTIIVDTNSPELERVSFLKVVDDNPENADRGPSNDLIKDNNTAYYNNDVEVQFVIYEANLYEEDVWVSVIKDGGEPEEIDKDAITWSTSENDHDRHIGSFMIAGDGDYQIYIDYVDRSGNIMVAAENTGISVDTINVIPRDSVNTNANRVEEADEATDNENDFVDVGRYESHIVTIDKTLPVVEVIYENIAPHTTDNTGEFERSYFGKQQKAFITITEHNFHEDGFAPIITGTDSKGLELVDLNYKISDWEVDENNPDVHRISIEFNGDANYIFDVEYEDLATNNAEDYKPDHFTVDTNKPTGTVKATSAEGREVEWSELEGDLNFGFWSKEFIDISSTQNDSTSPILSVEYYIAESKDAEDATEALTHDELENVTEWNALSELSIVPNKRFTVYLKITDNAGNYDYISTDGLIVDNTKATENIAPETTIEPQYPLNGIYNGDVKVSITVDEPLVDGAYSGLKTISYKVYDKAVSAEEPTQSGTLYTFDKENPKQSELEKTWTGDIVVDSSKNNSNDIVIEVYAEDNALNTSTEFETIRIDTTQPVINISYDNNSADNKRYFKDNRTATIVVTERNFNPDDVVIKIENTDGKVPGIAEWKKTEGLGNLDDTKWTTTITYRKDGDYTFAIKYVDLAGNVCDEINYGDSVAPTRFTIDKTLPEISVRYDNNNAENGKYFSSERTATVVIKEHNFNINRVDFVRSSKLDGKNIAEPDVLWSHSGDIHTATIRYVADGDYTFDVKIRDKAGNKNKTVNYGNSVAGENFTVDKTPPTIEIDKIDNGKAYKDDADPIITFSDVNYYDYDIKILRTRMGEKNVDVTSLFERKIPTGDKGGSGSLNPIDKILENDGIYTLTVEVMDKAGNTKKTPVIFTVNRFGSVYEYGDYLITKIKEVYSKSIISDLVVTEYNADRLVGGSLNIEITCDGKPLNDVKYDLSPVMNQSVAVGSSGWFQYMYTISKDNFKSDGIYKIFVSSEDATGNKPENSNYEDKAITFMVDSTAPEITSITGLEKAIVNATEQEVKYTIFDTIGLKSVVILVDGKQVGDPITNFGADLNNYSGTFKIGENSSVQNVQLIVEDLAGNKTDTDSETFTSEYAFNSEVTVSTNFFVRWFANKPLFIGSIVGFIVLIAAIMFIVIKRRKKNEE